MKDYIFTSESVTEGHPDKICDQIADAIVDAALAQDPYSNMAVECTIKDDFVLIYGECNTKAELDYETIALNEIKRIGYTEEYHVHTVVNQQSPEIHNAVNRDEVCAGDQGIMFGYATKETEGYMPLAISIAHHLVRYASTLRHDGTFKWARPDMKAQVTIDYTDEKPVIDTILMSIQHDDDFDEVEFKKFVKENIMDAVVKKYDMNTDYRVLINPTGRFVIGGPHGDTGLTGRKIIVYTYGGYARHGGGAFSGKDPTKVDRSAAYMARYIAKNVVAANMCDELEIQLSYAIGVKEPTSIYIDTKGTEKVPHDVILEAIKQEFDLTPAGIIHTLNLRTPIYKKTASYGHFGRPEANLPWEQLDKVENLKKYM